MDGDGQNHTITTTEALERLYNDAPYGPALVKEASRIGLGLGTTFGIIFAPARPTATLIWQESTGLC